MVGLVFTRYLYALDEAILTLQESIITKKSFDECCFWVGEIFYSKHQKELWDFIFQFYYDFCAINNDKLEKKIYDLYDLNSIEKILNAIFLLFYCKNKNIDVFYYRNGNLKINKTYLNRKMPKSIAENISNDKTYYKLIKSLESKNLINISCYINQICETKIEEFYNIIKAFYEYKNKKKIKKIYNFKNNIYKNNRHILLAFVCYLVLDKKSKVCLTTKYHHSEYIDDITDTNTPVKKIYKTLPQKLKYSISLNIGYYPLERFKLKDIDIIDAYRFSWDYFAYNCNLWRDRFNKNNIKINKDKKRIDFLDDEVYDDFCDLYYYEPDEQSLSTQRKAIPEIKKITFEETIQHFKKFI